MTPNNGCADGESIMTSASTASPRRGWRARLGMLLPSGNVAAESQFNAMLPDGVSLHTTRLKLTGSTDAELLAMTDRVEDGATLLADACVDLFSFIARRCRHGTPRWIVPFPNASRRQPACLPPRRRAGLWRRLRPWMSDASLWSRLTSNQSMHARRLFWSAPNQRPEDCRTRYCPGQGHDLRRTR